MPYYPKNRIITNLYTNGGEFNIKSNSLPYEGYYYKLYNGEFYSGKTPNDGTPQPLVPTVDNISPNELNPRYNVLTTTPTNEVLDYLTVIPKLPTDKKLPLTYYPNPTPKDYELGEITRYFVKKINEPLFIEVSSSDYEKIISKDPQYLWEIYLAESLPWSISGNKNTVISTNRNLTELLEYRSKWVGFIKYITLIGGFDKFYK